MVNRPWKSVILITMPPSVILFSLRTIIKYMAGLFTVCTGYTRSLGLDCFGITIFFAMPHSLAFFGVVGVDGDAEGWIFFCGNRFSKVIAHLMASVKMALLLSITIILSWLLRNPDSKARIACLSLIAKTQWDIASPSANSDLKTWFNSFVSLNMVSPNLSIDSEGFCVFTSTRRVDLVRLFRAILKLAHVFAPASVTTFRALPCNLTRNNEMRISFSSSLASMLKSVSQRDMNRWTVTHHH